MHFLPPLHPVESPHAAHSPRAQSTVHSPPRRGTCRRRRRRVVNTCKWAGYAWHGRHGQHAIHPCGMGYIRGCTARPSTAATDVRRKHFRYRHPSYQFLCAVVADTTQLAPTEGRIEEHYSLCHWPEQFVIHTQHVIMYTGRNYEEATADLTCHRTPLPTPGRLTATMLPCTMGSMGATGLLAEGRPRFDSKSRVYHIQCERRLGSSSPFNCGLADVRIQSGYTQSRSTKTAPLEHTRYG